MLGQTLPDLLRNGLDLDFRHIDCGGRGSILRGLTWCWSHWASSSACNDATLSQGWAVGRRTTLWRAHVSYLRIGRLWDVHIFGSFLSFATSLFRGIDSIVYALLLIGFFGKLICFKLLVLISNPCCVLV